MSSLKERAIAAYEERKKKENEEERRRKEEERLRQQERLRIICLEKLEMDPTSVDENGFVVDGITFVCTQNFNPRCISGSSEHPSQFAINFGVCPECNEKMLSESLRDLILENIGEALQKGNNHKCIKTVTIRFESPQERGSD